MPPQSIEIASWTDLSLLPTPAEAEQTLASRIRAARKAHRWTQATLARRAGLALATVARLERTGQGQISSLTRVCAALGRLEDFDALLRPSPPTTLDALRRQSGR